MTTEIKRPPGRPRSQRARQAALEAALALAAEHGSDGLTMEAIARRAAVSKDTLYRWWRSKTDVLLEALADYGDQAIPVPESGSLARDLRGFMRATSSALDPPTRRLLRTLAAGAAADTAFAVTVRERFLARRRAALASVLETAVSRKELTPARAAMILDLVFGSLWYRLIFAAGALDQSWADAVADTVLATASDA